MRKINNKISVLIFLFLGMVFTLSAEPAVKVVTGVEKENRNVESTKEIDVKNLTVEESANVELTSSNRVVFKPGTHLKKGSSVNAQVDNVTEGRDSFVDVENVAPPQSVEFNILPENIEGINPVEGIVNLTIKEPGMMGQAMIDYPIILPEGVNGLTPQLKLLYSSGIQGGDCGYGWNIMNNKIEYYQQDGVPAYTYKNANGILEHKYIMNDMELVYVSTESDGGAIYRKKVDNSIIKIKKKDNIFTAYYPDGTEITYGANDNSRVRNNGYQQQDIFRWNISKIVDPFGNKIEYEYVHYNNNSYIDKIKYGFTDETTYLYYVQFHWQTKEDVFIDNKPGFAITYDRKLVALDVFNTLGNTNLKTYFLEYTTGAFGKTLLSRIMERGKVGILINDHSFTYNTGIEDTFGPEDSWPFSLAGTSYEDKPVEVPLQNAGGENRYDIDEAYQLSEYERDPYYLIDMNNDGLLDVLRMIEEGQNYKFIVELNNEMGFSSGVTWYEDTDFLVGAEFAGMADMNADGFVDFMFIYSQQTGQSTFLKKEWYYENTGSGLIKHDENWLNIKTMLGYSYSDYLAADGLKSLTDINGDGLVDFYFVHDTGRYTNEARLILNSRDGFLAPITWDSPELQSGTIDINCDGIVDAMETGFMNGYVTIPAGYLLNSGSETDPLKRFEGLFSEHSIFVDLNADGFLDHLVGDTMYNVNINLGGEFQNTQFNWIQSSKKYPSDPKKPEIVTFFDINGDGAADMVRKVKFDEWYVKPSLMANKNLLISMTNNTTGVKSTLSYGYRYLDSDYQTSKNYRKRYVLESVTNKNTRIDATGNNILTSSIHYSYKNGIFDAKRSEFRGFETFITKVTDVSITDRVVENIKEVHYYNDLTVDNEFDQYLKGQIETEETYIIDDGNKVMLTKSRYIYEVKNIVYGNNEVKYVNGAESWSWFYRDDGTVIDPLDTAAKQNGYLMTDKTIEFYPSGQVKSVTENNYGDPLHASDNAVVTTLYTNNEIFWLNMAWKETITDGENKKLFEKKAFYDNSRDEGIISAGHLTREEFWNNNTYSDDSDKVIEFEYDIYGNIEKKIIGSVNLPLPSSVEKYAFSYADSYNHDYMMIATITSPQGLLRKSYYDWYGNVAEMTDYYGVKIVYTYDAYNRIIETKKEHGTTGYVTQKVEYWYDSNDALFFAKQESINKENAANDDELFLTQQYIYDCLGRIVQIQSEDEIFNPVSGSSYRAWTITGKVKYDAMGRAVQRGDIGTESFYEEAGYYPLAMTTPSTRLTYDGKGRVTSKSYPNGVKVTYGYDIKIEENFDGGSERRIVTVLTKTDDLGHEIIKYSDLAGTEVKKSLLKGDGVTYIHTRYIRDLYGKVQTITPEGNTITEYMDSLGRIWKTVTSDAGTVKKKYYYNDLVSFKYEEGLNDADTVKRITEYQYDSFDRLILVDLQGENVNDIKYDFYPNTADKNNAGKLKNIYRRNELGDFVVTETFKYDFFSRQVTKKYGGVSYDTNTTYDIQNRVKSIGYPNNVVVNYFYNYGGALSGIADSNSDSYIRSIGYDKYGQRIHVEYGNNVVSTYTYDGETQSLDTYSVVKKEAAGETLLLDYDYDFNLSGNIERIANSRTNSVQSYEYDNFGRLEKSNGSILINGKTETYSRVFRYNDDNRILQKDFNLPDGGIGSYIYHYDGDSNGVDYITDETGASIIDYTYDDFGNQDFKNSLEDDNKDQDFSYYNTNRMKALAGKSYDLTFTYDSWGQRTSKSYAVDGSVERSFVYINGYYTGNDIGGDGTLDVYNIHIWDGSKLIATEINNTPGMTQYYHTNHIGSTALITDAEGDGGKEYYYYPYGEVWQTVDNSEKKDALDTFKLFTGQELDRESNLYYYNARYYDPDLCTFTRPDPAMDGVNHYGYVVGNPIEYEDPTGLYVITKQTNQKISWIEGSLRNLMLAAYKVTPYGENPVSDADKAQDGLNALFSLGMDSMGAGILTSTFNFCNDGEAFEAMLDNVMQFFIDKSLEKAQDKAESIIKEAAFGKDGAGKFDGALDALNLFYQYYNMMSDNNANDTIPDFSQWMQDLYQMTPEELADIKAEIEKAFLQKFADKHSDDPNYESVEIDKDGNLNVVIQNGRGKEQLEEDIANLLEEMQQEQDQDPSDVDPSLITNDGTD